MKVARIVTFALLSSFIFFTCGDAGQSGQSEESAADASAFNTEQLNAQQQLWDEVMAIHDEVMPKMGAIHQRSKTLKNQWETNESLTESSKEAISVAIQELESADEGMWDWMHGLKKLDQLRSSSTHEEILSYLKDQEQSIILVREAMNNSMAEADSIISALDLQ